MYVINLIVVIFKKKKRKHGLEHWVGNTSIGLPLLAWSSSVQIVLLEGGSAGGDQSKKLGS